MMGGGRMGKNNYNSRSSSSSSMYNDEVRELQCWCPRICVVRKANTVNNGYVDEAEELGYFKNNGVGHGRNARLMEKPNDRGREEVWRARLMDKVDCVGSELKLIKILI
ncbi:hypothetical protein MtrunA17_Chr2g0299871 [Medicago truncatula]|uniref:Uncharacterized protein n=1 Tax=Medicago truncatula TaxID=3880 RepID=A0A396J5Y1_MEDTR|nr:hypothetical protein MtrunA17_Chr2g0299871 [Medicago truncatula]